jgi:hypothetical protein
MNRRNVVKSLVALPFAQLPTVAHATDNWVIIGRKQLEPNTQSADFALKSEIAGVMMIGIEVKNNSVWLYDLKLASLHGMANAQPFVLNDPATAVGCLPNVSVRQTGAQPKTVELSIACLPCTNRPIEILLWGTA